MNKDTHYYYWVLKIPFSNKYIGKRSSTKLFTYVGPSQRIRYLSPETARKGMKFLSEEYDIPIVVIRVKCTIKSKKKDLDSMKKMVKKPNSMPYSQVTYSASASSTKRSCPSCGPMRDCDQSVSSFCHICGPMSYCMCNDEEMRPGCGM